MPDPGACRSGEAYSDNGPVTGRDEPDDRARKARRERLLDEIDGALARTRANDPDWLEVSAVLTKVRCELNRDLRGEQPRGAATSVTLNPQ